MFPSHPLFRRFENEWVVGGQKLEWTTYRNDFVLRPQEADETIVWFFLGRLDIARNMLQPTPRAAHVARNLRESQIFRGEQIVRTRPFWRWWPLENGEEYFLRKNLGLFRSSTGELVRFDFPAPLPDVYEMKGVEIERFLRELSSFHSDLETAKQWAKAATRERVRQLFQLSGGSHDELEALIRASLVLRGEAKMTFSMEAVVPGRVSLHLVDQWTGILYVHSGYKAIPDPLFDLLNQYFQIERTQEEWRGHDDLGDPVDVPYPVYSSIESTQHERIEAMMVWRDFLRDKMPSEEIEALLQI